MANQSFPHPHLNFREWMAANAEKCALKSVIDIFRMYGDETGDYSHLYMLLLIAGACPVKQSKNKILSI